MSGNSQFQFPFAISIDPFTGSVYVVDVGNNRIQKFTNSGAFIRSWGTYCVLSTGIGCFDEDAVGNLLQETVNFSTHLVLLSILLTMDMSTLQIHTTRRIQEFTNLGVFVQDSGEYSVLVLVHFSIPLVLQQIHLTIMSTSQIHTTRRIQEFTNLGVFVRQWGIFGTGPGAFQYPFGIATNPSNGHVYVIDTGNHRVQEFTNLGVFCTTVGSIRYWSWCISVSLWYCNKSIQQSCLRRRYIQPTNTRIYKSRSICTTVGSIRYWSWCISVSLWYCY